MANTFGYLIDRLLSDRDISLTYLHRELNNLGVNVTYPSLYSYLNLTHCPSNEIAKKIVRCEKLSISDSELAEILEATRQSIKEIKEETELNELVVNLKIKPEQIDDRYKNNSFLLKKDIKERINELMPDKKINKQNKDLENISAYVTYLIKKDLNDGNIV